MVILSGGTKKGRRRLFRNPDRKSLAMRGFEGVKNSHLRG